MAEIVSLCYQPKKSEHTPPYHYNRVPVEQVQLVAGRGIRGDRKAGHNPKRQLNLMSFETLETLRGEGFMTQPGEMGEQIVLRGLDVMSLPRGAQLQLGDSAIIEITMPRTPCDWFELIQQHPKESVIGRVGVLARVLTDGVVRVGDTVRVLEPTETLQPG